MTDPKRPVDVVGFDHVDLRFRDKAKAAEFFVEGLGLEVIGEGPEHTFVLFGDQVLGLRASRPGEGPSGVDHVALRLRDPDHLEKTLKARGIEVTGTKERDDSRSWYLRGPEGLQVELIHRPDPHTHACDNPPAHAPKPRR